jgi:hypothetical protein
VHRARRARLLAGVAMAPALAGAIPATASAIALSVTGDDGNPVALAAPLTIRNMNPTVGIAFAAGETAYYYRATFAGPDGIAVGSAADCYDFGISRTIDYRGNGAYSVTLQRYSDSSCTTAVGTPQVSTFTIAGGVALTAPAGPVLIRQANSTATTPVPLPITLNPGALTYEVRYAAGGVIGPDGGISGPSSQAYVDTTTGQVPISLSEPGRYTVVARAEGYSTSSGNFFTPWSQAVTLVAKAPFDIASTRVLDSRGPSYRISVRLGETSARGRVNIAYGRGRRGRYHSLGTARLSRRGSFSKRFRITRTGTYRMRFRFRGSSTVAGGSVVERFRITRRLVSG